MPVVYHCPHCRQPVSVPDHMLGQALGCPHCGQPFQTFPPQPAAAPAPPPPPPPAQPFSLDDDEEPASGEAAFENLDDELPRRRRKGRDRDRGATRSRATSRHAGRYQRGQQKMPLSQLFGMIGAIAGGVGTTVFNMSDRRPGQGFDVTEMLIAGLVGGVCAGLGFLIGKAIEMQSEPQKRPHRRQDDDDEDDEE